MEHHAQAAGALQAHILENIPLARSMGLAVIRYGGNELEMSAPLGPNINDKGCAFGGSMASLLTLAGWGLIETGLRGQGLACDLYIGDSHLRYQAPVWDDLHAVAQFAETNALAALAGALREHGKGRVDVVCEIVAAGRAAAVMDARFFARTRA